MEKYGNIRFTRRVVAFVCMFVIAVSVLMTSQAVSADTVSTHVIQCFSNWSDGISYDRDLLSISGNYSFVWVRSSYDGEVYNMGIIVSSPGSCTVLSNMFGTNMSADKSACDIRYDTFTCNYSDYLSGNSAADCHVLLYENNKKIVPTSYYEFVNMSYKDVFNKLTEMYKKGELVDNIGFQAKEKAYSEIGCLDNVQMETYITNKKELDYADENADLAKINQDKVIVYSSTSTTGIDLSKGGYKVQLYGSYAWQDKSGNIKSEDKGHKTFIKDWNAKNNIKGLNRSSYTWIDWKSANDKVEADKSNNAHKPNAFEKMTTYANYQFEPIWYLRIVSQDNKYGAWVKLYNSSTKKGNYDSDSVDDDGNKVSDSDGGYDKTKSTSEITGTGDTPEDAKDNVQKSEEKQDNKDIQDASGGNNSTFDKLEEFTKGIGDVPKMIADIFSFLPSWCLEVVAIGFALLMILIVVKFIRG